MKNSITRAIIECGFIIFLFYSNLLMGEFNKSGQGTKNGIEWALSDVFTPENFVIGLCASLVGYLVFEILRDRTWNRKN